MLETVNIYGDSIMKGTVLTETLRYHATINDYLEQLSERFGVQATSRARFGMTIDKGSETLEKDIADGVRCDVALVEFGGNDCDYDWAAIANDPDNDHQPHTPIKKFVALYTGMLEKLKATGIKPLLMTLPPIDAAQYLDFLCRDGKNKANIIRWLGDVQRIYRTQERYSGAVAQIACKTNTPIVDVRSYFLMNSRIGELIGKDGIHPTVKGYELILKAFEDYIVQSTPSTSNRLSMV